MRVREADLTNIDTHLFTNYLTRPLGLHDFLIKIFRHVMSYVVPQ
jgi:hypothetical protein